MAKKIILGAAGTSYPGWVSTEKNSLDIEKREDFARYWNPNSRSFFLSEHVFEHLTEEAGRKAMRNCYEFLRPGGQLRIAVPDGYHPDPSYIEWVRPRGNGDDAMGHKVLFNYRTLKSELEEIGFEVVLLEYWDEDGHFYQTEWFNKDGPISRSSQHDIRNQNRPRAYTSLIVDAIKP